MRKLLDGTFKEVQEITVGSSGGRVENETFFYLEFNGAVTGAIPVAAQWDAGAPTCDRATREVQTLTASTSDTTHKGGDNQVSALTSFTLTTGSETTGAIEANPSSGDCSVAADSIESELESLSAFYDVTVSHAPITDTQGCVWSITFDSSSGNLDPLEVTAVWDDDDVDGPSDLVAVGDDTLEMCAEGTGCVNGAVDIIKSELELLSTRSAPSRSSRTARSPGPTTGACSCAGHVRRERGRRSTDAARRGHERHVERPRGRGPASTAAQLSANQLEAHPYRRCDGPSQMAPTRSPRRRSSERDVRGARRRLRASPSAGSARATCAFDAVGARRRAVALESLSTVGAVDVVRSDADVNGGYTWSVTFLTNLGDVGIARRRRRST